MSPNFPRLLSPGIDQLDSFTDAQPIFTPFTQRHIRTALCGLLISSHVEGYIGGYSVMHIKRGPMETTPPKQPCLEAYIYYLIGTFQQSNFTGLLCTCESSILCYYSSIL